MPDDRGPGAQILLAGSPAGKEAVVSSECSWREATRAQGNRALSLFRVLRAARADSRRSTYDELMVHLDLMRGEAGASHITIMSEACEFIRALLDAETDEKDVRRRLAQAFLEGSPIDPSQLKGRESEIATMFYLSIEQDDEELPFPSGSRTIAICHGHHRRRAQDILAASERTRGEQRTLERKVFAIADDFLSVIVLSFHFNGASLELPADPDGRTTALLNTVTAALDVVDHQLIELAKRRSNSEGQIIAIKAELNDLRGRNLSNRIAKIRRHFNI